MVPDLAFSLLDRSSRAFHVEEMDSEVRDLPSHASHKLGGRPRASHFHLLSVSCNTDKSQKYLKAGILWGQGLSWSELMYESPWGRIKH